MELIGAIAILYFIYLFFNDEGTSSEKTIRTSSSETSKESTSSSSASSSAAQHQRERPSSSKAKRRNRLDYSGTKPFIRLDSILLVDLSESSLQRVIRNANNRLTALRNQMGASDYPRAAAIQLTGETIVASELGRAFLEQNMGGGDALSDSKAKNMLASKRRAVYKDTGEVFLPFFENEDGIVDLNLFPLRSAAQRAARGNSDSLQQVEYMYTYYHTVLGAYYGWQRRVLAGASIGEAAGAMTDSSVNDSDLHPPVLQTVTAYFKPLLVDPNPGGVGRFEPLYTSPNHYV